MKQPKASAVFKRTIALCYIRLSYTLNPSEADSIERQIANCQAVCDRKGWTAEFYQDAKNHKSGRQESNRPGWLALKERMNDPDVIAIVANDVARLHRKGWRVGQLLDWIEEHNVYLVLAAPGRELDLSNPRDRLNATFISMMDEYYAADISQRVKDSVRHRQEKGISAGRTPFGTVRDDEGYLTASPYGAWRLPDGSFVAGTHEAPPTNEQAEWKSYYECARRILEIYREDRHGHDGIAFKMQAEGWAFRDRYGQPRQIEGDDVRRVISNWREFAGLVGHGRAKDQNASLINDAPSVLRDTGRAVFDLDLIRQVAEVQTQRSVTTRAAGSVKNAHSYALTGLLWCAACEREAIRTSNMSLHSKLLGTHKPHGYYYRHAEGHRCAGKVRSVPTEIVEADVRRLIGLLNLNQAAIPGLLDLSLQVSDVLWQRSETELQQEKTAAIAKAQARLEAARFLYSDGELTRAEYLRRRTENETEIAHWEARTTDSERLAMELALCVDALNKVSKLWDTANDEDRQGLTRMLFESITYDLTARRITDFRLKPWAERFVILREALYESDEAQAEIPASAIYPAEDKPTGQAAENELLCLDPQTPSMVDGELRIGAISAPTGAALLS